MCGDDLEADGPRLARLRVGASTLSRDLALPLEVRERARERERGDEREGGRECVFSHWQMCVFLRVSIICRRSSRIKIHSAAHARILIRKQKGTHKDAQRSLMYTSERTLMYTSDRTLVYTSVRIRGHA